MGKVYTEQYCKDLLLKRLDEFGNAVERCVKAKMSDQTEVAFISLAYNVGEGAFCKSSVVRLYNEGRREDACNAMLRFNRAGGRVIRGLALRRQREQAMCLKGL